MFQMFSKLERSLLTVTQEAREDKIADMHGGRTEGRKPSEDAGFPESATA